MPGTVVRVLPRTFFDHSAQATGSVEKVVAKGVEIGSYVRRSFVVRLHGLSVTSGATGWKVEVIVRPDAPTDQDPGVEWQCKGSPTDLGSLTIDTTATNLNEVGDFGRLDLTDSAGGWVKVVVKVTQGGTPAAKLSFDISADLVLTS